MFLTDNHIHYTPHPTCKRVPIKEIKGVGGIRDRYPIDKAAWLWCSEQISPLPTWALFQLKIRTGSTNLRFQVSADQFFWLYVDGHLIGRGPDASPPWYYGFSEYEVQLESGDHELEAFVWCLGDHAPLARMTDGTPGFCLAGIGEHFESLTTGVAPWQTRKLEGYTTDPDADQGGVFGLGANGIIDARALFDSPSKWSKPHVVQKPNFDDPWGGRENSRVLHPSRLPEMPISPLYTGRIRAVVETTHFKETWPVESESHPIVEASRGLTRESSVDLILPPHSKVTLLWDLENYCVGWPKLEISEGRNAQISLSWAESLYEDPDPKKDVKGMRREVAGKYFRKGVGDCFIADGGMHRCFIPTWWRSGCFCQLEIETKEQPLVLHEVCLLESAHPMDWESKFSCEPNQDLQPLLSACHRTLKVSCWDTFVDSPYCEQLQYVGDTRLEMLILYACTNHSPLPLRALELLEQSRCEWDGLCASRFPCRHPQLIGTFSMIYVWCVRDLMMWRNEPELLRTLIPSVRNTLDLAHAWENEHGVLEDIPGWSFVDWDPSNENWKTGVPPDADGGVSGPVNSIYLLTLQAASEIERLFGESEYATVYEKRARRCSSALREAFMNEERGVLSDDLQGSCYSTQGQILGILSGVLSLEEGGRALDVAESEGFLAPTYVFRFYLFEALYLLGRAGEIPHRLSEWREMLNTGAYTLFENQEPTRSDCHAWSSHPLFHLPCSVAGIRPSAPGFREVLIAPQPGDLKQIGANVAHPEGSIHVDLVFEGDNCKGSVELPPQLTGLFDYGNQKLKLSGGRNLIGSVAKQRCDRILEK